MFFIVQFKISLKYFAVLYYIVVWTGQQTNGLFEKTTVVKQATSQLRAYKIPKDVHAKTANLSALLAMYNICESFR